MNKLLIKGGRVIDPANGVDGIFDVYAVGGKIAAIEKSGVRSQESEVRSQETVVSSRWSVLGFQVLVR